MYIQIDKDILLTGELSFSNTLGYYIFEFDFDGDKYYIIDDIHRSDMDRPQTTDEFFDRIFSNDNLVIPLTNPTIPLLEGMNNNNTFTVADFIL